MYLDPFPISSGDYQKLQAFCPLNTYRVVKGTELPFPLPRSLADKVVGAVIVGSGAGVDRVDMMNLHRRDTKAAALDQQPLRRGGTLAAGEEETSAPPQGDEVRAEDRRQDRQRPLLRDTEGRGDADIVEYPPP